MEGFEISTPRSLPSPCRFRFLLFFAPPKFKSDKICIILSSLLACVKEKIGGAGPPVGSSVLSFLGE